MSRMSQFSLSDQGKRPGSDRTLLSSHCMYLPEPAYAELDYRASWDTHASNNDRLFKNKTDANQVNTVVRDNPLSFKSDRQLEQVFDPSYIEESSRDSNHEAHKLTHDENFNGTFKTKALFDLQKHHLNSESKHQFEQFSLEPTIQISKESKNNNTVYDGVVEGYHCEMSDSYTVWSVDHAKNGIHSTKDDTDFNYDEVNNFSSKNSHMSNHFISLPVKMLSPNIPTGRQIIQIGYNIFDSKTQPIVLSDDQKLATRNKCGSKELAEDDKKSYKESEGSDSNIMVTNLDDVDINELLVENVQPLIPPLDLTMLENASDSDTDSPLAAPRNNCHTELNNKSHENQVPAAVLDETDQNRNDLQKYPATQKAPKDKVQPTLPSQVFDETDRNRKDLQNDVATQQAPKDKVQLKVISYKQWIQNCKSEVKRTGNHRPVEKYVYYLDEISNKVGMPVISESHLPNVMPHKQWLEEVHEQEHEIPHSAVEKRMPETESCDKFTLNPMTYVDSDQPEKNIFDKPMQKQETLSVSTLDTIAEGLSESSGETKLKRNSKKSEEHKILNKEDLMIICKYALTVYCAQN